MTVYAWDGKTLAADKQSTNNGYAGIATKIHRVPDGLVAFGGDACHASELLVWFMGGRKLEEFPKAEEPNAAWSTFINAQGQVFSFGYRSPHPERREDKFIAGGCGRDYALAAMHLGCDARRAVEVACALDINCGMGIDTLELNSP